MGCKLTNIILEKSGLPAEKLYDVEINLDKMIVIIYDKSGELLFSNKLVLNLA
jgi:hypothetical protein